MGNIIVCEGNLIPATASGREINNVLACDSGWVIKPEPLTDFQDLVALLSFDPEIFAWIFGISVLLFITGLGAGHVARILNRH